jgi:hypothetical protein
MGTIWIREFTGGLDTRRLPECTSGGVLITASDGHITCGGAFEKRAAFVELHSAENMAGTVGLARTNTGLVVFGDTVDPGVPVGVTYQRLQHPTNTELTLSDVPSYDLFGGKIYAVGVFSDGSVHHYYDGVYVEDWFDGRARAVFSITGGGVSFAEEAVGAFTITGGTSGGSGQITAVTVNSVTVTSAAVDHTSDNATTATAVAANITAHTSSPNYTAYATGATVYIVAPSTGPAFNGLVVAATTGGDATVAGATPMAGGRDETTSSVTSITVNGSEVLGDVIEWGDSHAATAELVVAQINDNTTDPNYTAVSDGADVIVIAAESGAATNGRAVVVTGANGLTVSPSSGLAMAGGADLAEGTFQPGSFVRTIDTKMNATSGPNWHFSGIKQPTEWATDAVGAGFIDVSTYSSGSEQLVAIAQYQNLVAMFSGENIIIFFPDPDPALYRKTQLLRNTGTVSPLSLTEFGEADLFYLDESGVRSLRARDSSNAASAADLGVPVDTLINSTVAALTDTERARVSGLIEQGDGRFWLCVKDKIFVYTFFQGANVKAWSTYSPGFDIERTVVHQRRVYLRATDGAIYVYGGTGSTLEYDDTQAVAQTPYLDAETPTKAKQFTAIDAALVGEWEIHAFLDPTNTAANDLVARVTETTYGAGTITGIGEATHISLRFRSLNDGYAKVESATIHYTGDGDEDRSGVS